MKQYRFRQTKYIQMVVLAETKEEALDQLKKNIKRDAEYISKTFKHTHTWDDEDIIAGPMEWELQTDGTYAKLRDVNPCKRKDLEVI